MTNGKFLTAPEKETILKSFTKFIKGGCKPTQFTKAVYRYLSNHFGFIAHYNQGGFYECRFADPQGRISTVSQILQAEFYHFRNENTSDCADLNQAIKEVVEKYQSQILDQAKTDRKNELQNTIAQAQAELKNL